MTTRPVAPTRRPSRAQPVTKGKIMPALNDPQQVEADLTEWARGIYPTEAAVRLLIGAFGGRFARPGWPWIARTTGGRHYIDAAKLGDDEIGMLSGGEQRVLTITRSLLGGAPVDLSDALTGLDQRHTRLVIDALAHAAGVPISRPASPGAATRDFGVTHDNAPGRRRCNESKGIMR